MDGARIKQVLLNLVGNAIKFTPEAGPVWVRAQGEAGSVRVEVGDTGPGIPAAEQERIFQEFQQVESGAKGKRRAPGSGWRWRKNLSRCMAVRSGSRAKPAKAAGFSSRCRLVKNYLPQSNPCTKRYNTGDENSSLCFAEDQ